MGFKEDFVAALRSGEYKQARGTLRCEDGFCVHGVAVDVAIKNGYVNQLQWEQADAYGYYRVRDVADPSFTYAAYAPQYVVDLMEPDIDCPIDGYDETLMSLNDHGMGDNLTSVSFLALADIVEENFENAE